MVWCSSASLISYLAQNSKLVRDKHVLELGAGTGIVGLACAQLGAAGVLLTDLPLALPVIRSNIVLNDLSHCAAAQALPWGDVEAALAVREGSGKKTHETGGGASPSPAEPQSAHSAASEPASSSPAAAPSTVSSSAAAGAGGTAPADSPSSTSSPPSSSPPPAGFPYSLIVASDVAYHEEAFSPLVSSLRQLCSPATRVLLAHQFRSDAEAHFFHLLGVFFDVAKISRKKYDHASELEDEQGRDIYRLRIRPSPLPPRAFLSCDSCRARFPAECAELERLNLIA